MRRTTVAGGIRKTRAPRALLPVFLAAALAGCSETDSFLFDPSVVGRWEHTPARVPILSRLASIEGPEDEFFEYSDVSAGDLVPEVTEYRIGPGDQIVVTAFDLPDEGRPTDYPRIVDTRGYIEIPQLGQIYVNNMTSREAAEAVKAAMRTLIADPLAFVIVSGPRTQHFSIFGAVQRPGQYQIPTADYHLLEALTAAEGFSEAPDYIYIIRQVPLSDVARGRPSGPPARPGPAEPPMPPSGEKLLDIIDQLSKPAPTGATGPTGPSGAAPAPRPGAPTGGPGAPDAARPPAINLIDRPGTSPAPQATPPPPEAADGTWVNIQGKWVKVRQPRAGATTPERMPGQPSELERTVTQRVIRIPTPRVAMGDARYNIVVRPGDVIRVPPPPAGTIYIAGQVARPGAYQMAERLTLTRALTSAGGLSSIAVPERVDIIRMVGVDRQGFVRVNYRAVEEGTHPDVFLKANDRINVGTNFWATPLAVIRNGFRASYGFGFIADRNFGSDIFGVPPESRARGF